MTAPDSTTPEPAKHPRDRSWLALGVVVLAAAGVFALFGKVTDAEEKPGAEDLTPPVAADCLKLTRSKADYFTEEANRRAILRRIAACRAAHSAQPDDLQIKVALATALTTEDRGEAVTLLRSAAAQNDAEANYQIYEQYKSWDQHDDRVQLVTRAEAERGLRRAAELGHPFATYMLAILLDRGRTVKRDAAQARLWAARAAENPPADVSRATIMVFLAGLLARSDSSDERTRGRAMLEQLAAQNATYNARTTLAEAIRGDDPLRARNLLESALRSDPGGTTPPLADMLIKGEGGPADPTRAVKLLRASNEIGAIHGALGQLHLEGRLVPRDVPKAIELIRHAGVWDYEARLQVMQLLAAHPEVRIDRPGGVRYDATEAAELGEPGGLAAAIALKLSAHPQFRDQAGACEWVRLAKSRGESITAAADAACPPM